MDTILQIIKKIENQKRDKNSTSDFATKREIWLELFQQMEIELELLWKDGKVVRGDTINYDYYKAI